MLVFGAPEMSPVVAAAADERVRMYESSGVGSRHDLANAIKSDSLHGTAGEGLKAARAALGNLGESFKRKTYLEDIETCIGCIYAWQYMKKFAGGGTRVELIANFKNVCNDLPGIFYESCDGMSDTQEGLMNDYMAGVGAVDMCLNAGLCSDETMGHNDKTNSGLSKIVEGANGRVVTGTDMATKGLINHDDDEPPDVDTAAQGELHGT